MSDFIPQTSISAEERFKQIYAEYIHRPGSEPLMQYLESTDFFTAPASTRHHLAREGGLVTHSVHVYDRFHFLCESEAGRNAFKMPSFETIAICALLHDVCKINFYAVEMKNVKGDDGVWRKEPRYVVQDTLPYGHGEKSVYQISGFMKLSREEAFAIRWHMGGFDDAVKGGSYALSGAFSAYPLCVLLHIADLQATYLDEAE